MRTVIGAFICLSALTSLALAASERAAPLPTYHIRGYYKLGNLTAIWQYSDNSPWQVVENEPWIDPRLVKWGYVPMRHDSKNYLCLIDDRPITGSNIARKTFICGDVSTTSVNYDNNWRPTLMLYGGGP